jgi:hypothetical protein
MSARNDEPRDMKTLSGTEREWLRRQGKAARALETQQRQAARRVAWRGRPVGAARKRSRSA